MKAQRMTVTLRGHLRIAGLLDHFTMRSFRVGGSVSKSSAGTAVGEIMKIGRWKTDNSEVLHRVDDEYTGSIVQEDTGRRVRTRERVVKSQGNFSAPKLI